MNSTKLLIGTLAGFAAYFLSGFVLYTMVFASALESAMPNMKAAQTEPNMVAIVVANLAAGFLLAWIFERWASIRTLTSGAMAGGIIGFLIALSYDCMFLGTTNLMTWNGVLLDSVVYAIGSAIAGAAVGWALGFRRAA